MTVWPRLFSACQKSLCLFCTLQKRHIFCENRFSRKISLRSSKSLINQAFLMAINPISSGAFFSLRLGHAAALTCPRHVIHYRAAASLPLELPCCSIIFLLQHSFSFYLYLFYLFRAVRTMLISAVIIFAKTALHQIIIWPPSRGGRASIRTSMSTGSAKVRI